MSTLQAKGRTRDLGRLHPFTAGSTGNLSYLLCLFVITILLMRSTCIPTKRCFVDLCRKFNTLLPISAVV